jgi:hypothetical protein
MLETDIIVGTEVSVGEGDARNIGSQCWKIGDRIIEKIVASDGAEV